MNARVRLQMFRALSLCRPSVRPLSRVAATAASSAGLICRRTIRPATSSGLTNSIASSGVAATRVIRRWVNTAPAAAVAVVSSPSRDRILLKGLVFHGFHGAFDAEAQLGQKFVIDAELYCDLRPAGESDDLSVTIDYGHVFKLIQNIVESGRDSLVETVANRIARTVLQHYTGATGSGAPKPAPIGLTPSQAANAAATKRTAAAAKAGEPARIRIEQIRVTVKKPHVAVSGVVEYLGVEILRTQNDYR